MSVNLVKGQKINLSKEVADGLTKVMVGLGWDAAKRGFFGSKPDIDCDASAIILGKDGKYRTCVYYGDRSAEDRCVYHHGDNLTGEGEGDDEVIKIKLDKIPSDYETLAVTVTIYDAESRLQNFGMVGNAYVRVVDEESGEELIRFDLSEDFSTETALVVAEIYKHNGEWKFKAVGSGYNGGLKALCNQYGIDAE